MAKVTVPEPISEEIPDHLHLKNHKHTLVFFDLHSPRMNKPLVEAALKYAALNKIDRLILGGDSLDLAYFSYFLNRTKYSPDSSDKEMTVTEELFKAFFKVFKEVIYLPGNHDDRWGKAIDQKIGIDRLLRMVIGDECLKKMVITERRYLTIDTPCGVWRITHQIGKGRSVPLSTVLQYSTLHNMNVASGHEHFLGAVRNKNNSGWAVQGGHMSDESLMEYKSLVDGNYTVWAPGFLELDKNGRPILWEEQDIYRYLKRNK